MSTSKRIPQLDGLRTLAIVAVFLRHALGVRMLWMGVDVFFVLSGFLITGILIDMKGMDFKTFMGQFYSRRVRRIIPPYLLLLIVVTVFFSAGWAKYWYMYFGLMNYVQFFQAAPFLPMPLWSLGVEEQFYLLWPPAVYFLREKKLPYVLLGLIVAAPVLRGIAVLTIEEQPWNYLHWFIYESTPTRMDCMAVGALITLIWRRYSAEIKTFGYLGLVPAVLTPPLMIWLSRTWGWSTQDPTLRGNVGTLEISLIAATGIFLWALGGRYTGILTWAPMQWVGKISYSFYLIHMCMIDFAKKFVTQPVLVALMAFAGSILYAAASWYWMEKPILHGGSRKVAREEVRSAMPDGVAEHARV